MTEPSDRDLMVRLAAGDRDALAPLMERHSRRLYRIALGYLRQPDDALDVVQETFVKAFVHAARWDGAAEVAPWLTRIAVNQAIDFYRRGKRRRASEEPLDESSPRVPTMEGPSPERRTIGREIGERVGSASARAPRAPARRVRPAPLRGAFVRPLRALPHHPGQDRLRFRRFVPLEFRPAFFGPIFFPKGPAQPVVDRD